MNTTNSSRPPEFAADVERINEGSCWWHDDYRGSADALIAAGLVTVDQLPGQPGRNKVQCSYYRGEPIRKGTSNVKWDEHYLRIARDGKRAGVDVFRVTVGIPSEEQEKRRRPQLQAVIHTAPRRNLSPGAQGQCSATLPVGAEVVDDEGWLYVIDNAYGQYRTDGGELRYGYTARDREGVSWFFRAGALFTPAGKPTHLRLVVRDSTEASGS